MLTSRAWVALVQTFRGSRNRRTRNASLLWPLPPASPRARNNAPPTRTLGAERKWGNRRCAERGTRRIGEDEQEREGGGAAQQRGRASAMDDGSGQPAQL